MAGVNKVILVGNLGRDPEVRSLESGAKVARFSIATTESYKDRNTGERVDQTEWHNVVLWRGLAEIAERFLVKGRQVYIEGKLQTRQYEDANGVTKYSTEIVGQNMTLLGNRGDEASGAPAPAPAQEQARPASQPAAPAQQPMSTDEVDDLPF